jgi:serine protease Do
MRFWTPSTMRFPGPFGRVKGWEAVGGWSPVTVCLLLFTALTACHTGEGEAGEEPGTDRIELSSRIGEGALGLEGEGAGVSEASPSEAVPGTADPTSPAQELAASRLTAVVRAAERVSPAVVAVNVIRTQQVRARDPFWDDFFMSPFGGRTMTRRVPSLGSGFVVDPSGIILTNDHVVRGAERILVTLPDGRDLEAELVGTDEATDVAVIRVDARNLPVTPLGRTDDLRIGEWVVAFGNPFGNLLSNPEPTVTVGVVSALGRHIVQSQDGRAFFLGMVQTDAAINPGNSGGPLVNALGEVVGMNASIFSRTGGNEGLGFAIPIERVLRVADDLLEHGEVRRAWIGVDVEPVEADVFGRTRGVRAARVASGSPAARAGIRTGDRLIAMNGRRLVSPLDFEAVLLDLRAGDPVRLEIEGRGDALRMVTEELPSLRAERVRVFRDLELVTVTDAIRSERGVQSEEGALVAGISPELARTLGLQEGDVIVGINNRRVGSAGEVAQALDALPPGSRVRLYFERNRGFVVRDFVLR